MKDKEMINEIKQDFKMHEEKHKQIEEMAKCMADCETTCDECFDQFEKTMTLKIKDRSEHCQVYMFAKRAVEQGYRKPSEDTVMLTEREHEIAMRHQYDVGFGFGYKQARKETAREIYQELQGHGTTYVKKWIKEHYGVGGNNEH